MIVINYPNPLKDTPLHLKATAYVWSSALPKDMAERAVPTPHPASKLPKGGWKLNVQTATALIQGVFSAALQPGDHLCHILGDFLSVSWQLTWPATL